MRFSFCLIAEKKVAWILFFVKFSTFYGMAVKKKRNFLAPRYTVSGPGDDGPPGSRELFYGGNGGYGGYRGYGERVIHKRKTEKMS